MAAEDFPFAQCRGNPHAPGTAGGEASRGSRATRHQEISAPAFEAGLIGRTRRAGLIPPWPQRRNSCFLKRAMDMPLQTHDSNFIDSRRLIAGLKNALDMNYARVLDSARQQWERNFAGKDPSDACVSVRITSGQGQKSSLACGGILRKSGHSFLNGNGRRLLA